MEYPLNIYITAHTLISSLGFGIPENLEAIHNYRSGIRMQEAGLISDHPLLAGMIDSVELEKRAKLMQITDYTCISFARFSSSTESIIPANRG